MLENKTATLRNEDCPAIEKIIDNSIEAIFVTDKDGKILMVNPASADLLNIPMKELKNGNVSDMVSRGYYHRSTALEAVKERREVTGLVKVHNGLNLISTSRPLFDAERNITMVITYSRDKDALENVFASLEKERRAKDKYQHQFQYYQDQHFEKERIVARSKLMCDLLSTANKIAPTDSNIMLYGESGTGKEIVAKYIHRHSKRLHEAFITVNCGSIPENLLESELFGYEKGAFTGANAKGKLGLFEIADKGTIFMDEIGEMPLSLQPKLLRVLETMEVRRVGSTKTIKVDVRVLGATNRDLKKMIHNNEFREDLYYRLNVIPLTLPTLRDRPDDILTLADMFLNELNKKYGYSKFFAKETMDEFINYKWPGNVRELRNVVERLVLTNIGDEIKSDEQSGTTIFGEVITASCNGDQNTTVVRLPGEGSLKEILSIVEQQYIQHVLNKCNGCVAEAAKKMEIHRSALYRKINKNE